MSIHKKTLPFLASPKTDTTNGTFEIQRILKEGKGSRIVDYRASPDYVKVKAANFLSRKDTLDDPSVIFTLADQISSQIY